MAKVFNKNKAINHFLWEFLAAFHKAKPFQGKVQAKIKNQIGADDKIGADEKRCSMVFNYLDKSF